MGTYRRSGERERSLVRCAVCDATAKVAGGGSADANTVCASCGMTQVELCYLRAATTLM